MNGMTRRKEHETRNALRQTFHGSVSNLVEARPPAGILSCVAARSHRASSRASWATVVWKKQHKMLQLQERHDDTMWAKGRKWCHGLGKPITDITKHGVRLTPPKLQLIPFHSLTTRANNIRNLR